VVVFTTLTNRSWTKGKGRSSVVTTLMVEYTMTEISELSEKKTSNQVGIVLKSEHGKRKV